MASLQEMEQRRDERVRQESAFREYALNKYGEDLGTALYDYLYRNGRTEEEREEKEIAFANALALKSNSRDIKEVALGLVAMLEATRGQIAPVARRAMDASLRTSPIGH
ncbi:MAG: hypothetical protein G01um10145_758 [Microgenomates group bacterium Gr01-1014_5]|nr:MAG: hypothetical protein G01um10145_758 [Microgenomates group bacterium Gr01-1014_5]